MGIGELLTIPKNNLPLYKAFREHGVGNFFIELVEKCPCNDVDELRKKEGEYIRNMKPPLNVRVPGRTLKEFAMLYGEKNKELIAQHKAEKITCECGREVCYDGIQRHRRTTKHMEFMKDKLIKTN